MGTELKGREAEIFCAKPRADVRVFLLSGDDDGVLADAAEALVRGMLIDGEGVVRQPLPDDVTKSREALANELSARPLIGDTPLLVATLVNETASASIIAALERVGNDGADHNPIAILTPKLKKSSKLRGFVAAAARGVVLEFYADREKDIEARVRERLSVEKVDIEPSAVAALIAGLPGHRRLANQEVEKLALFGRGLGRPVTREDVKSLSAVESDAALFELTDAVFARDPVRALETLEQLLVSGTQPFAVMRALDREFARMNRAHELMSGGDSGSSVGRKLSPPVFDWAWAGFESRLRDWPLPHVVRALSRLGELEEQIKTAGPLSEALVTQLIGAFSAPLRTA